MNSRTKLRKRIHDLKGIIDAYERSGHKKIVRWLRSDLRKLENNLVLAPKEKDDGWRFSWVGWVR